MNTIKINNKLIERQIYLLDKCIDRLEFYSSNDSDELIELKSFLSELATSKNSAVEVVE